MNNLNSWSEKARTMTLERSVRRVVDPFHFGSSKTNFTQSRGRNMSKKEAWKGSSLCVSGTTAVL